MFEFDYSTKYGILFSTRNRRYPDSGCTRLFSKKGPVVYSQGREISHDNTWALKRMWSFWFFAIIHIGEGKSPSPNGWHITFCKLFFKKSRGSFSFNWQRAPTYETIPARRKRTWFLRKV